MARNTRQNIRPRSGVQIEVQFTGFELNRLISCQSKGSSAEFYRADTQQQMVHNRISNKGRIQDVSRVIAGLPTDFLCQLSNRSPHHLCHFLVAARVHHDIRYPTHQILTEADLWVHHARGSQDFTGRKITQMYCYRG